MKVHFWPVILRRAREKVIEKWDQYEGNSWKRGVIEETKYLYGHLFMKRMDTGEVFFPHLHMDSGKN